MINSSLRGIIEAARQFDAIGTVYGARHGIEGVLKEELLDLSAQSAEEVALLRFTPAAGSIGTCRYKLKPNQTEDFRRVIEVLRAHQVGYLLYIGGNDSMDTANKIAQLAQQQGLDLVAVGVPKTIDNDVGDSEFRLIDHTPGYGSVARYWMHKVQTANEENAGSCPADPVLVMQAMGRKIGFIPAAARLADPEREMPLQIYLAESPCTLAQVADQVERPVAPLRAVPGGYQRRVRRGRRGQRQGRLRPHLVRRQQVLCRADRGELSQREGFALQGRRTGQRGGHRPTPLDGLCLGGGSRRGVSRRAEGGRTGRQRSERLHGDDSPRPGVHLRVRYDKVPLGEVANSERTFPKQWIAASGCDVTDDFVRYAKPLLGSDMLSLPTVDGRQRMTRFAPIYAEQKLPKYVPQTDRSRPWMHDRCAT